MNDTTTTADPELEVIFTPEAIAGRLDELASEIAGARLENLLVVAILKGSFVFAADLIRALYTRGAGAGGRFHDAVQLQEGAHLVGAGVDPARHGSRRARPQRPHRR